jgi:hypothetical protein
MSFNFEPLQRNSTRNLGRYLTLDRQGRIRPSAQFRREFSPVNYAKGLPMDVYVFLEKSHKIVGFVSADMERMVTSDKLRFDKRGYASGRDIAEAFKLDIKAGPWRFDYIGKSAHEGYSLETFKLVESES